jgi:hypothetical protein
VRTSRSNKIAWSVKWIEDSQENKIMMELFYFLLEQHTKLNAQMEQFLFTWDTTTDCAVAAITRLLTILLLLVVASLSSASTPSLSGGDGIF